MLVYLPYSAGTAKLQGMDGAAAQRSEMQPASDDARASPVPVTRPGTVTTQPAAETLRLYAGDWQRFRAYCAGHGETALPASPEVVAAFLQTPGTGRAALARRLAAIDHQHRQSVLPPLGLDASVRAALRRARRAAPRQARAAAPTPAALTRMAAACHGDLAGHRDRALLLLASGVGRSAVVSVQAEQLRFLRPGSPWWCDAAGTRRRRTFCLTPPRPRPARCAPWRTGCAPRPPATARPSARSTAGTNSSTPPSAPTRSASSWPGAPPRCRRNDGPDSAAPGSTDAAGCPRAARGRPPAHRLAVPPSSDRGPGHFAGRVPRRRRRRGDHALASRSPPG